MKTKAQLSDEVRMLRTALQDMVDVVERPQRYHLFIDHRPSTQEGKAPGLAGAKSIHARAKSVLARTG
jgi:hypothetical protein